MPESQVLESFTENTNAEKDQGPVGILRDPTTGEPLIKGPDGKSLDWKMWAHVCVYPSGKEDEYIIDDKVVKGEWKMVKRCFHVVQDRIEGVGITWEGWDKEGEYQFISNGVNVAHFLAASVVESWKAQQTADKPSKRQKMINDANAVQHRNHCSSWATILEGEVTLLP